jgi:hypothetical protein
MPGYHKAVLAALGAAALGVSLAAGSAAMYPSTHVRLAADVQMSAPGDPLPGDPDPNTTDSTDATNATNTTKTTKVSANTASQDAIAAALRAAGVPSPNRWAAEVVEYRPYALDDLGLAKLRENLAKYNPAQQTVDQIVSVLLP